MHEEMRSFGRETEQSSEKHIYTDRKEYKKHDALSDGAAADDLLC